MSVLHALEQNFSSNPFLLLLLHTVLFGSLNAKKFEYCAEEVQYETSEI